MLELKFSDFEFECGTDEAGRGCLAGPVTAAAVILPRYFKNTLLNDSKQLSHKKRELLKPCEVHITKACSLAPILF